MRADAIIKEYTVKCRNKKNFEETPVGSLYELTRVFTGQKSKKVSKKFQSKQKVTRKKRMQRFKSFGVAVMVVGGALALTQSADAQSYERQLAGVRLNTSSKQLLAKFGNPNEVFVGDVAVRTQPGMGGGMMGSGGMGGPSMGGAAGTDGGDGPSAMGGKGGMGGPSMGGGMPSGYGPPAGMMGRGGMSGPPSGMMGSGGGQGMMGRGGMGGPGMGGDEGGGMPGGGMSGGGMMGGGGMGGGAFGNTNSTGVSVQEVTWVYNRKFKNDLISYEFLLSPQGTVSQIRVVGYTGGYARTQKGIVLGSSMADVINRYGHPEKQSIAGQGILLLDYSKKHHMTLQLQLQKVPNDPVKKIYRVIAIVVATIES
jgi:hypothetical protein